MAETLIANLINPQVMSDYIEEKLTDNIVFMPLAEQNTDLVGAPGDTVSIPKYGYIGDATVVAENGQVTAAALTATKVDKKVQKYAKAVTLTDEAALSAYGNPEQEVADQLMMALDSKIDVDFVDELADATLEYGVYNAALNGDTVAGALELFGEDQDAPQSLLVAPADLTGIRLDDDHFIKASDLGQQIILSGTIGGIWGCQVRPTNRLAVASTAKNRKSYIVRQGALGFVSKRGVQVEQKREADYFRTMHIASKLGIPYLRDESKVVEIISYLGLDTVASGVVTSTAGTTASNDTFLAISEAAPVNTKWVYKLGTSDPSLTFGTALSGYTDWVSATTEIAASTSTKASVCLVWAADSKPLKYANVTLVKKA